MSGRATDLEVRGVTSSLPCQTPKLTLPKTVGVGVGEVSALPERGRTHTEIKVPKIQLSVNKVSNSLDSGEVGSEAAIL